MYSAMKHFMGVPYVLDNTPPFLPRYFVPEVGRGLILEYAVSLDYKPPQPCLLHTLHVQTPQKVTFTLIRAGVVHANKGAYKRVKSNIPM